jgi:hypothetical protein
MPVGIHTWGRAAMGACHGTRRNISSKKVGSFPGYLGNILWAFVPWEKFPKKT